MTDSNIKKLQIIGLKTSSYVHIRESLKALINKSRIRIDIEEINDIEYIIKSDIRSIPVVIIGDRKFNFLENRSINFTIEQIQLYFQLAVSNTENKNCTRCSSCRCKVESSDLLTDSASFQDFSSGNQPRIEKDAHSQI